MKEMSTRRGELVAMDEPAVATETLLDTIVVEDGQSGACLANSASTDESDRSEVSCQTDDLLNQLVASIEDPWWWRR